MGKVDFKGIDIHFSEKGAGRALVLLHGFLENRTMWDSLTGTLSKRFRVVAIDLPGHGQTPCLGYVHTMEEMADAVKAVLDHLGLRRYVMVGHSMGGYVT
ncbi:MAG: alpha/beta fold hydrolase, partial [Bacteroidota bacterium]|nr:alpha/beta fold hydrolase [Bacteroidota bacterium]MDX5505752.1 alpha/beta fold hydrolase [Bacteroidota bacterium]